MAAVSVGVLLGHIDYQNSCYVCCVLLEHIDYQNGCWVLGKLFHCCYVYVTTYVHQFYIIVGLMLYLSFYFLIKTPFFNGSVI